MAELPSGTVTFLFTDLEGSTRLWDEHAESMRAALARHDAILRATVESRGGYVVKTTGDGVHAAFATADDALGAAVAAQLQLRREEWPEAVPLRVRVGIHTGPAEYRDGDYYSSAVNRAARLMSVAHGGQVVVSHVTEQLVRDTLPEDVALLDLGEHRLRDLGSSERVFQVTHRDLESEFPALRSLESYPGNLPLQLTSFVGRDRELTSIAKALAEWRLVTLTGVGGVGKTRLAAQVAADVLPGFEDGAWFCELAAASDPDAMAQVIATALAINPRAGMTLDASITEFLRPKQILVVLDNCEHLLGAVARLAQDLLRGCPNVRLLATSREGLGIDGEHLVALRSLSLPEDHEDDMIESSDAVRLFVDRAAAGDADFVLDATTAPAVVEICRRLDGIPLAIELAAARSVAMSAPDIAARLDERFRLLTGGRRTAVERHQTLRATVDWSYSMLATREQTVFNRLGVFAGSFDAAAAEAVASGGDIESWDVVDALTDLVAKSMVVVERGSGSTRYQLLETIRAYARERLDDAGDADHWRHRHAAYYADFAEATSRGVVTVDELQWRRRQREELDNFRAAVNWSLERSDPEDLELGIRIVAALAPLAIQDRPTGVGTWAIRAVDIAQTSAPRYRTAVLAAAAEDRRGRGQMTEALEFALDAVSAGVPEQCPAAHIAFLTASVAQATFGELAQAFRTVHDGIAALERVGDNPAGRCVLLGISAMWAVDVDRELARANAQEGLDIARGTGNPSLLATALYTYAWVLERESPDLALACFEESLTFSRGGASTSTLIAALTAASILRCAAGDLRGSLDDLLEALHAARHEGGVAAVGGPVDLAVVVFASCDAFDSVAVLAGTIASGALSALSVTSYAQRWGRDDVIEEARRHLGDTAFEAAAAHGAALLPDELVTFMLDVVEQIVAGMPDA